MNILLFVATNPIYPYVHPLTMQTIWAQQWNDPIDVMFGWQVSGESAHPYADLNDKMNRARDVALHGDYDAIFFVEADMILPVDALQRLMAMDTDVAYALYCSRHNHKDRPDNYRWLAFNRVTATGCESWSMHPARAIKRKAWGRVRRTYGLGFGCTLVRRHVLEAFPFRTYHRHKVANDWNFSLDCQAHGFTQMHDFSCICGHILSEGDKAIWPDVDAPNLHVIEEIDNAYS